MATRYKAYSTGEEMLPFTEYIEAAFRLCQPHCYPTGKCSSVGIGAVYLHMVFMTLWQHLAGAVSRVLVFTLFPAS